MESWLSLARLLLLVACPATLLLGMFGIVLLMGARRLEPEGDEVQ